MYAVLPCPLSCFKEIRVLSSRIRFSAGVFDCPDSNGYADVIETECSNLSDIIFDYPCIPVWPESVGSFYRAKLCAVCEFVDDAWSGIVVDAGRDPRLGHDCRLS